MMKHWMTVLIFSTAVSAQAQSTVSRAALEAFCDDFFLPRMEAGPVPGAVFAAVRDGEIFFSKGYNIPSPGIAPVDPETSVIRVASVAKLLTALAVMKLVDQGKIDPESPVNAYLTRFRIKNNGYPPIRIKHLLTHTEGFTMSSIGSKTLRPEKIRNMAAYVEESLPVRFIEPGQMLTYGNHASALLGVVVEEVSGRDFASFMEEEIFTPLGMEHSSFRQPVPNELLRLRAQEYRWRNEAYYPMSPSYSHMVAGGGLHASAGDLARLLTLFQKESDFMKWETIRMALRTQFRVHPELAGMTYGFLEGEYKGRRYLYRSGDSDGAKAKVFLLSPEGEEAVEKGWGFVVVSNSSDETLREEFLGNFLEHFSPSSLAPLPAAKTGTELSGWGGLYYPAQGAKKDFTKSINLFLGVRVRENPDGTISTSPVMEEPFGGLDEPKNFIPLTDGLYRSRDGKQSVVFQRDGKGKVYLFSDTGYHGSYVRVGRLSSPLVNQILYFGLICIFLARIIMSFIKKRVFSFRWGVRIADIFNLFFLSLYLPVIMFIGMTPGLPAYVKGITPLMIVHFSLPVVSLLLYVTAAVRNAAARGAVKISFPLVSLLLTLCLYYGFILYWRLIFF